MSITVSGNANIVGNLFSSMASANNNKSFATDLLGINYTDYATIRSGSYHKLLSAYYAMDEEEQEKVSTSTSKDSTSKLAKIKSDAEDMGKAADKLLTQGSKSVFNKVTTTDKDGNKTTDYNVDEIYKVVNAFAEEYNSLVKSAGSSNSNGITAAAASMVNYTNHNSSMLSKIGISVDSENNTIKVDEEAFKKADMDTVKSMFNGTASYAYQVSAKASMMKCHAESESFKANTYNSAGKYANNFSAGDMWNSWI